MYAGTPSCHKVLYDIELYGTLNVCSFLGQATCQAPAGD